MFGKFTWKEELHSRLDLAGGQSPLPVVPNQFAGFTGKSFKGVIDEGVHDVHGLLADADLGVHLLEDLVDVEREGLDPSLGSSNDWCSSPTYSFCSFPWSHYVYT